MSSNVLIIFGTRPEAIKMAPVVLGLRSAGITVSICVTAQHRGMLDSVLAFFNLTADFDLDLMQPNQSLNLLSSRIFEKLDGVLQLTEPNLVLVHGDTTTSVMAAWACFHRGIKVGHIEAGLRTHNKKSPFPEELNRQITSKIADYHFAPTVTAKRTLLEEGIRETHIVATGNTVIDALHIGLQTIENGYESTDMKLARSIIQQDKKMILVTGHRRENFGSGFEEICSALHLLSQREDVHIVYPVHLNPNVQEPVNRILGASKNISLLPPLEYPAFIYLMSKCYLILTDSGGIQEEAPSLGKPVLVMRDTTERPEAIEAGTALLVGTISKQIVTTTVELLDNPSLYRKMVEATNPYGDGKAANHIVQYLKPLLHA